jgi:hypothetical protein
MTATIPREADAFAAPIATDVAPSLLVHLQWSERA